jgi:hypothetical protein
METAGSIPRLPEEGAGSMPGYACIAPGERTHRIGHRLGNPREGGLQLADEGLLMKRLRIYLDTSVIGGCFDHEFSLWSKALIEDFLTETYIPAWTRSGFSTRSIWSLATNLCRFTHLGW